MQVDRTDPGFGLVQRRGVPHYLSEHLINVAERRRELVVPGLLLIKWLNDGERLPTARHGVPFVQLAVQVGNPQTGQTGLKANRRIDVLLLEQLFVKVERVFEQLTADLFYLRDISQTVFGHAGEHLLNVLAGLGKIALGELLGMPRPYGLPGADGGTQHEQRS